jgi:hypothetical protein
MPRAKQPKNFPLDVEDFLAGTARLLAHDGARAEVRLLSSTVPEIRWIAGV